MASDDLPSSQRGFWAAEKILSERRERGERLVLVQWEGTDDNGEKWKPTWEPVGNCTEELVEEWEEEKRLKKEESRKRKRSTTSTARGRSRTSSARSNSTASTAKEKDKEPERPRKRQRRDMEAEVKSEEEMPPPAIKKPVIRRDEEEEEEDRPAPRRPSSVSLGKIKRKPSETRFEPVQYDYDDIPPRSATAGPSRSKSSSLPPRAPSSEPDSPPSLRAKPQPRPESDSDSPPPAKSKPSTSKFRPNAATIARSRAPLKRKARDDPYVSSSDSDSGKGKGKAVEVEGEEEEVMKVGPPRGKRPSKPLLKKPFLPSSSARNSVPATGPSRKPGPASRTSAPAPAPAPAPKQTPFVLDPSLKSAGLPPSTKPPLVPSKPKPKPAPSYPHESYETAAQHAVPLEEEEDTQAAGPSPFALGPGPRPVYEPVSDYMRHAQTVGEYIRVNGVGNVEAAKAARRNAEMNAVAGPSKIVGSSRFAPGLEKVVAPSQGSIVPGTQSTRPDDDSREEEHPPPAPARELSPVYARSISPVVHSHVDSPAPRPRSASPPRSSPQVKRTYGRKGSGARVRDVGGDESIVAATVTVDDEESGQGQGDAVEEEEKEVTPASARDLTLAPDPEFAIVAATTPAPVASEREESSASEEEEEESEEDEDEDAEGEDEEIRSQASLPPSPSQAQPQPQPHAFRAIAPRIPITAARRTVTANGHANANGHGHGPRVNGAPAPDPLLARAGPSTTTVTGPRKTGPIPQITPGQMAPYLAHLSQTSTANGKDSIEAFTSPARVVGTQVEEFSTRVDVGRSQVEEDSSREEDGDDSGGNVLPPPLTELNGQTDIRGRGEQLAAMYARKPQGGKKALTLGDIARLSERKWGGLGKAALELKGRENAGEEGEGGEKEREREGGKGLRGLEELMPTQTQTQEDGEGMVVDNEMPLEHPQPTTPAPLISPSSPALASPAGSIRSQATTASPAPQLHHHHHNLHDHRQSLHNHHMHLHDHHMHPPHHAHPKGPTPPKEKEGLAEDTPVKAKIPPAPSQSAMVPNSQAPIPNSQAPPPSQIPNSQAETSSSQAQPSRSQPAHTHMHPHPHHSHPHPHPHPEPSQESNSSQKTYTQEELDAALASRNAEYVRMLHSKRAHEAEVAGLNAQIEEMQNIINRTNAAADSRSESEKADAEQREHVLLQKEKLHNEEKKLWGDKERRWVEERKGLKARAVEAEKRVKEAEEREKAREEEVREKEKQWAEERAALEALQVRDGAKAARIAELETQLVAARTEIEATTAALTAEQERTAAAQRDVDFYRGQYEQASTFVKETRAENDLLVERTEIAEGQARDGVQLIRAEAVVQQKALEDEITRLRTTNDILVERARRTDDDIRERAALEPEWRRQVGRLEEKFELRDAEADEALRKVRKLKKQVEVTEEEVERLEGVVAKLRAKALVTGAGKGGDKGKGKAKAESEEEEEEDEEEDEDFVPRSDASSSSSSEEESDEDDEAPAPAEAVLPPSHVAAMPLIPEPEVPIAGPSNAQLEGSQELVDSQLQPTSQDSLPPPQPRSHSLSLSQTQDPNDPEVQRCLWIDQEEGGVACDVTAPTIQALKTHYWEVHHPLGPLDGEW